jgi:hypothetical protein
MDTRKRARRSGSWILLAGILGSGWTVPGCGDPKGDAAYSQAFEKPASLSGSSEDQNPYALRSREKDEDPHAKQSSPAAKPEVGRRR